MIEYGLDVGETLEHMPRMVAVESQVAEYAAHAMLRDRFRYSPGLGWLEWRGGRWADDPESEERVREALRLFMKQQVEEAKARARAGDAAAGPLQADLWRSCLTAQRISSILILARAMDGILTPLTDFDQHPELLNCTNGVVDLRTGKLRRHDPKLLMTKMAGGPYDPDAASELWEMALAAVPHDLDDWFQARVGQSLTGYTPDDDALIITVGTGENGKSAVMSAIMRAAGSYGRLVSHRILLVQPGQHPTEMMDLRGLRFALMEETPEEGHLDTHQLKTTVGTPQITARLMRQDSVTFTTSHSLWINTNFLPQVDTTDHGTWRRLKAMDFPFRFLKPGVAPIEDHEIEGDPTLKPRPATDPDVPAAVISWIVDGARKWFGDNRISPPDPGRVASATEKWRAGSDVAYLFALECLSPDPESFIPSAHMTKALAHFIQSQGKKPWSARTMNLRLPASIAAAGLGAGHGVTKIRVRIGEEASLFVEDAFVRTLPMVFKAGDQLKGWRGLRLKYSPGTV